MRRQWREKLAFNKRKPPEEPDPRRAAICRGQEFSSVCFLFSFCIQLQMCIKLHLTLIEIIEMLQQFSPYIAASLGFFPPQVMLMPKPNHEVTKCLSMPY